MSDLATLRSSILKAATVEQIADFLGQLEIATKTLREMKALGEEQILGYLRENGLSSFEINGIKYYEGVEKKTECHDTLRTMDAVLGVTGGDLKAVCDTLVSQPFKPATVRNLIGAEAWGDLFTVTERPDLKTGKPERKLISVNTKYLKGAA